MNDQTASATDTVNGYEIPLMPRKRNEKFDVVGTILLWNYLPATFSRRDFLRILADIDRSESWGYSRLNFWIEVGTVIRIKGGEFVKS